MKISVKAVPVKEVIHDLAQILNISIEFDSGEQTLQLPEKVGKGYIRGSGFDFGLGIMEYNCTFNQDVEIHFVVNKIHPLKFIFCSKGRVDHCFEEDDDVHTIYTYQNVIVSSSGNNGHVLFFKAHESCHILSLEIVRDAFARRQNYLFKGLDSRLKKIFIDSVARERFFYQGNYSLHAADIVEEISVKEHGGFLRSLFLEGKLYEMLVLQIKQYQEDQQKERLPQILRRADVEKIRRTVDLIHQDLSQNHSVDYLAKEAGTNVNKLQDGFKYMFNLTVNKYMQQAKLEAAKKLLVNSDFNISQIVNMIGLNNRSYFSKIFKDKYGVSPKYFLTGRKEIEVENEK